MKKCLDCKKEKPLSEFYNNKSMKGGKYCYCKECHDKRVTKYLSMGDAEIGRKNKEYTTEELEDIVYYYTERPDIRIKDIAYMLERTYASVSKKIYDLKYQGIIKTSRR